MICSGEYLFCGSSAPFSCSTGFATNFAASDSWHAQRPEREPCRPDTCPAGSGYGPFARGTRPAAPDPHRDRTQRLARRPPERDLLPLDEAQAAPLQATTTTRPDPASVYQNTAARAPVHESRYRSGRKGIDEDVAFVVAGAVVENTAAAEQEQPARLGPPGQAV